MDEKLNAFKEEKLSAFKSGAIVRVLKINAEPKLRRRLFDMGLTLGTSIEVLKTAPFNGPLELLLRGYHLTIRAEEAFNILVTEGSNA
jgi:Fe2+ transport system protein FeoA